MASSSGSRDRRWAAVSGSAGSGAPRSGLAASRHSAMASKEKVVRRTGRYGYVRCCASMQSSALCCSKPSELLSTRKCSHGNCYR